MKKIIFILLLLNASIQISEAQWIVQPTGTNSPIRDVEFINKYTGWACGDNYIYKTTNEGNNWIQQTDPKVFLIQQIFPVNEKIVYAVGRWNFLKSTDGGNNWETIFNGGPGQNLPVLEALFFINENTGWLAGNSVVMKTTNGGNSFVDSMRIEGDVRDIYFKDSLNGISCGMVADFQKTTNGGVNWIENEIIKSGSLFDFNQIAVVNDSIIWVGGKSIYKSINFGETWDSIGFIPTLNNNLYMYGLSFSSLNIGYASGNLGEMYKTTDGGYNWMRENSGSSTSIIYSIDAYNDSIVWASRGNGTMIHTTTGGQTGILNSNLLNPEDFILYQNFPNPFNPETTIKYEMKAREFVSLKIYDVLGNEITKLVNEVKNAGQYIISWNAQNMISGIYFYKIRINNFEECKKMLLIK